MPLAGDLTGNRADEQLIDHITNESPESSVFRAANQRIKDKFYPTIVRYMRSENWKENFATENNVYK